MYVCSHTRCDSSKEVALSTSLHTVLACLLPFRSVLLPTTHPFVNDGALMYPNMLRRRYCALHPCREPCYAACYDCKVLSWLCVVRLRSTLQLIHIGRLSVASYYRCLFVAGYISFPLRGSVQAVQAQGKQCHSWFWRRVHLILQ